MSDAAREARLAAAVDAFVAELRSGARPAVAAHAARAPELAPELAQLLATALLLEGGEPRADELSRVDHASDARRESLESAPRARIGCFELVREIGRGSMGVVYEALQQPLGRRVALKLLRDERLRERAGLERFQREAAVAARLDHPGICTVYEWGIDGGTPYIAMRLVPGDSLALQLALARAGARARPSIDACVSIVERVARAVHAAHEAGIVHRDLKPANVIITPTGEPVVLDFGLARELDDDAALTRSGDACGTPAYLAPERLDRRARAPGPLADVYALGVILYECLALRRPFEAATLEALYRQTLLVEPPDVRLYNSSAPRDLVAVVEAALEKDPARRYRSAAHFADDLRAAGERRAVSVRRVSALGRLARFARREPAQALLGAGAIAALTALAALCVYLVLRWPELESARVEAASRDVEARIERGFLAIGEGAASDALRTFDGLLSDPAHQVEAVAGLALVQLHERRAREALTLLDAHAALCAQHPSLDALRRDAQRSLGLPLTEAPALDAHAGELEHAIDGFRELRRGHAGEDAAFARSIESFARAIQASRHARALYWYGYAHAAGHAHDAAAARLAAARIESFWPDSSTGCLWRAFALKDVDQGASLDAWRAAARLDPGSLTAQQSLALALLKAARYAEAEPAHRRVVELAPDDAAGWWNLGIVETQLGAARGAAQSFCTALRTDSEFLGRCGGGAADALRNSAGIDAVLARCRELARESRDDVVPRYASAILLAAQGDAAAEAAELSGALELDRDNAAAHRQLGGALWRLAQREAAVAELERAVELAPHEPSYAHQLVDYLVRSERKSEAVAACRSAVASFPQEWKLVVALSNVLLDTGHADEAADALERAAELAPEIALLHFELGRARKKLGLLEAAERSYRAGLALDPSSAEGWCNLGGVLKRRGQLAEALDAYRRGHELGTQRPDWSYPSDRWVRECEEKLALEGDLDAYVRDGVARGGARELAAQAEVAQLKGLHPAAAELYARALELDPACCDDAGTRYVRYNAACAAARASREPSLARAEQARMRERARAWLADELAAALERAQRGATSTEQLRAELRRWSEDPDLEAVRAEPLLAELDAGERAAFVALWSEIERHTR